MADAFSPLTARIHEYATALALTGRSAQTFQSAAGPILEKEAKAAAVAAFGSDLRPFKNRNVRADVAYDGESTGHGRRLDVGLRPAGVWVFGEEGAAPHLIGGGRGKGKFLKAANAAHPVRGPIKHPGTDGNEAITRATRRVHAVAVEAVAAGIHAVLGEVRSRG